MRLVLALFLAGMAPATGSPTGTSLTPAAAAKSFDATDTHVTPELHPIMPKSNILVDDTMARNASARVRRCYDSNGNARDRGGDSCSWYNSRSSSCGSYDDSDFRASSMCCACGGGSGGGGYSYPTPPPPYSGGEMGDGRSYPTPPPTSSGGGRFSSGGSPPPPSFT